MEMSLQKLKVFLVHFHTKFGFKTQKALGFAVLKPASLFGKCLFYYSFFLLLVNACIADIFIHVH